MSQKPRGGDLWGRRKKGTGKKFKFWFVGIHNENNLGESESNFRWVVVVGSQTARKTYKRLEPAWYG